MGHRPDASAQLPAHQGSAALGNSFIALFQLSFKFRDALDAELFFFGSYFSPSDHLLWLLSGERGPPLEKKQIFSACTTTLNVF